MWNFKEEDIASAIEPKKSSSLLMSPAANNHNTTVVVPAPKLMFAHADVFAQLDHLEGQAKIMLSIVADIRRQLKPAPDE